MTAALYRRYRPETFGEMIGQSQVTEPLMTALRGDRVGHAYLFSGPRGCGKTTSARILARCLNCAEGPTDVPCGVCDSCVELSRGGGGSLDVVEIDAASHNGVDDARDLRERAIFAPARDRFKIFILDEAHMVTAQGFNALLKLVEEPPEHVKFIFATTEPEKVIGTIRSRTHHYPFRLVAPAAMLEYVERLCETEGVAVEPGVLPLVVRAGGGSPRDTLSLLDQLIAGSEAGSVRYERAVALLGYTHAELLDEIVDALGARNAAAAFASIDRVVQTGQDPRRFVDDLLERLRDLIVVAATGEGAAAVLRGISSDELTQRIGQAAVFGAERLSRIADLVVAALDDMTGATSPRLQLELMIARVLASEAAAGPVAGSAGHPPVASVATPPAGSGAGRPSGDASPAMPVTAPPVAPHAPAARPETSPSTPAARDASTRDARAAGPAAQASGAPSTSGAPAAPAAARPSDAPGERTAAPRADAPATGTPAERGRDDAPADADRPTASSSDAAASAPPAPSAPPATSAQPTPSARPTPSASSEPPAGPITLATVRAAWPEVLRRIEPLGRSSWMIVSAARPVAYTDDDILTLAFQSQADVTGFKKLAAGKGPSEDLRTVLQGLLGVRVRYIARHDPAPVDGPPDLPPEPDDDPGEPGSGPTRSRPAAPGPSRDAGAPSRGAAPGGSSGPGRGRDAAPAAGAVTEWAVTPIPSGDGPPAPASSQTIAPPAGATRPFASAAPSSAATPPQADEAAPVAQLAVDDEPEDAASAPARTIVLEREGEVIADTEPAADAADDEVDEFVPPVDADAPVPPRVPVVSERAALRAPGMQRYGEAVVRQLLGATFVREEPYTPPTRFG